MTQINRAELTDNPPPEWVGNLEVAPNQISIRYDDDGHVDIHATSNDPEEVMAVLLSNYLAIQKAVDDGLITDVRQS